ncbi:DUF4251 domain-containing protein [Mucilaginibacter daejeonensis]|uniref:DUF4251 domain-containing protein n=1 Tax=Mucilaginibacter daejeonensis TaxID=398049 RepID=UPI001D178481|nr:DUF4251 domain-containing protein [Mucilaginibacter daejeonensis]UEG52865.1 DUF4251 domain-containing protein [Mucilaginibacter daejeonensis]
MRTIKLLMTAGLMAVATLFVKAQTAADPQAVALKKLADGKSFTFLAKFANLSAISKEVSLNATFANNQATSANSHIKLVNNYYIKMTADSLVAYLPSFDNQYDNGAFASDGAVLTKRNETPMKYVTKTFQYAVKQRKKGNVTIVVDPKDDPKIDKFTFEIDPNGNSRVNVDISDSRNVSFEGVTGPGN